MIQIFCWKHKKIVVSAYFEKATNGQNCQMSQKVVQGWVKNWSKHVAQHNWTKFWLKKMFVFLLFICGKSHCPCRRRFLNKIKKKKEGKLGPSFDSQEGRSWSNFSLFWVKSWSKVESKIGPRFSCLLFPSFIVFVGCLKITNSM